MSNSRPEQSQDRPPGRAARVKAGVAALAAAAGVSLLAAGCGGSSSSVSNAAEVSNAAATSSVSATTTSKKLHIAYFSFAVQNSYDAAMLAAAQKAAASAHAQLTVFDANNNPQTQYNQVQDAIVTGSYRGFLVQAIDGPGLMPLAREAIGKHIEVVALSQVLGPDDNTATPQVPGERPASCTTITPAVCATEN